MPKRYGYLIPLIVERANMERAFVEVVSQLKEPRRTRYYERRDEIVARLTQEIADGSFRITSYREMLVTDGPKQRLVQSPQVEKRIGCNAIMRIVEDKLYPSVIRTSAASIPGRGMHRLFAKMRRDIENDRTGTRYYWKGDIRKFYESILQPLVWESIQRKVKDPVLLPMLYNFITMMVHGLSIGLRSSQFYGNFLLSPVDHHFKDVLGVRYYYRYCDDIVILAPSKQALWMLRDIMHEQVAKLGLQIKPNESVRPVADGIDFLGFVYDGHKALLRKRTKQKAARRQEIVGSLKGMAKWGDCKHLYKKLTGKNMESFSEASEQMKRDGINYTGKDGKRILSGILENLRTLVNMHITIVDFEADVPTKNGPRYIVQFQKDDGTLCKYLTNDSEQKFWLEEMRKSGKIPFDCNISPQYFGQGKVRYMFT